MNYSILFRLILAVIKVYPIWLIEWICKMIKETLLCLFPNIFFAALVTEKSSFIKNVTIEWTESPDPPRGFLACWEDVSLPKNIISDITFWFRYLFEANILNEKNSRYLSLSMLLSIQKFNYLIIDYEGKDNKLIKMIIEHKHGSFYYMNEKLETIKIINFDNISLA